MSCDPFESQILDLLENQLPKADRPKVEQHLRECAACRTLAENLRQLDVKMAGSIKPPRPSPDFRAKLQRWIDATPLMSPAEIAIRKRELQADYEAGLRRLSLLPHLPRKIVEFLGFGAMLAVGSWLVWLLIPSLAIDSGLASLSAANQRLLFLSLSGIIPILAGVLFTFSTRHKASLTWQSAGNGVGHPQ